MAIDTDAAIEFFGTPVNLASTPALVADGDFSVTGDLDPWTNVDDAPMASVTLIMEVEVTADDNSGCNMYFRAIDVEGSNSDEIPEAEYRHTFVGFFPALNVTLALQRSTQRIVVPNYKTSSKFEVYIENLTGQEITVTTWTVIITPIAIGPNA